MKKREKVKLADDLLEVRLKLKRLKRIIDVKFEDPEALEESEARETLMHLFRELKNDLKTIEKKLC